MAGYREFQTGEVLTAANVNEYLMEQSVMAFADAAARDTALGTAVAGGNALREGMLAYLNDTDALLKYDGTSWATVSNAGIGSNVVSTTKSDTFTTSSNTFTVITGLTATITPSSNTAKVLVIATVNAGSDGNLGLGALRLMRGATAIAIGDADGSRRRASADIQTVSDAVTATYGITFLDSPGVDTATTYSVEAAFIGGSGNIFVNRSEQDTDGDFRNRTVSSITAIEVAP